MALRGIKREIAYLKEELAKYVYNTKRPSHRTPTPLGIGLAA